MLPERSRDVVVFSADEAPRLLVIIDAEEEFDWDKPFSADNRSVRNIASQAQAHRVFEVYGLIPTYAVDYPVASQEDGYLPLLELLQSGACEVGAQLHPWVTPPHEEEITEHNSFANNLPFDLQRRKLEILTRTVERNFGVTPRLYRAGRYGAGEFTPAMLRDFGYEIDCSVLPGSSSVALAPSYEGASSHPYWLASGRSVLEIPVTIGEVGAARRLSAPLYAWLASPTGRRLKLPAVAARLGILNRIRLTPEGSTLDECKRLTRAMLNDGHRIFVISYHSPSLIPGYTPYVKDQTDLARFLAWMEGYFDFFFGQLGGIPSTPLAVRAWSLQEGCNPANSPTLPRTGS
ncbi:MAG TPA: hypothetical protein VHY79_14525 [Rhizomicrobium sp.]|jgi:hypothetical protein|nr:hypothetical protein [Rhizomicrobium sp.]